MIQLAELASANIKINHIDHGCRICGNDIAHYALMIVGASKCELTGYTGGFFHPGCWFLSNFHFKNMEVYKIVAAKYDQLGVANLKPITEDLEDLRKWDVVHNSLVNVEIGVMSIEPIETQYGDALLAKCLVKGEETLVLMGGQVLCQQLNQLKDKMPFLTTIIKTAKYYELS